MTRRVFTPLLAVDGLLALFVFAPMPLVVLTVVVGAFLGGWTMGRRQT